ncbi:MAG: T9SS type A sorting domain-containing protein [Bacteroidota bacterium]
MRKIVDRIGLFLLALASGKSMSAQTWVEQTGADNPFNDFSFASTVKPETADIDGDGDIDLVSGACQETWLKFLRNDGFDTFSEVAGVQNPFEGIPACGNPEFVDFDNDGDLDLFVGDYYADKYARLTYFRNDGNGSFTENINNPFLDINFDQSANIAFTDIDDDGDLDALIAEEYMLRIFENDGSNAFTEIAVNSTSFSAISALQQLTPEVVDFDLDGDEDVVFGNKYGDVLAFEKNGPNDYSQLLGTENPFNELNNFIQPHFSFFDYEEDGDMDLIVGEGTGGFRFYLNTTFTVGQEELTAPFEIYPNPADEFVQIETLLNINYVNIFDLQGQLILSKPFFSGDQRIDLNEIASGSYVMMIHTNESHKSLKFIKR